MGYPTGSSMYDPTSRLYAAAYPTRASANGSHRRSVRARPKRVPSSAVVRLIGPPITLDVRSSVADATREKRYSARVPAPSEAHMDEPPLAKPDDCTKLSTGYDSKEKRIRV